MEKEMRIKIAAVSQFCETFVSVLIIGIIRTMQNKKKNILVDRGLSAWGTCRSAIVFLHFLLPFIKFGSYLVPVQSSCQHMFGILAGTACEVLARCKIVPISCVDRDFSLDLDSSTKNISFGGSLFSVSRRSTRTSRASVSCLIFDFIATVSSFIFIFHARKYYICRKYCTMDKVK